ncbi:MULTISPECIES: bacillithiol system redox-active protein YtxJ [Cytobacillus]|uniref:Bacillithiol system redox-active protein YtxJ n=1 Tax=Cytobacillus stercorigallinarum TaxID=2762240 RepID=A0ABR8QJ12_9BACI|nr:bacillithiol system redox-active protein YtxJ [Cytobacillus stercorigallinarum]MBD7935510.1 bacillithiol system redox-active protein YtxJ [Cytobacillus stercorigallinarum]
MERLNTKEAFDQALQANEKMLLLKHSNTCPISADAYEQYEQFTTENNDVKAYYLVVQEDRPLSNEIAEIFEVKHESPQAFLFVNKEVAWHTSHRKITYDSLNEAVQA